MMKEIKKKVYYHYEFRITSAMNIGNGQNEVTDNDLIKDGSNIPYIPGSTVAGIFRSVLPEEYQSLFGNVEISEKISDVQSENKASQVILYDARMKEKAYKVSVRDSVALDEYKTSKPGAKFDFEVLEPGVLFETWLEQDILETDIDDKTTEEAKKSEIGYLIAQKWARGQIHFGSKSSRGLGQTKLCKVQRAEFPWDENGINQWLDFDMYQEKGWSKQDISELFDKEKAAEDSLQIILSLRQKGGISIRTYTTKVKEDEFSAEPDYKQMAYLRGENKEEIPVIPGSSWAGAFHHHIRQMNGNEFDEYFGSTSQKSQIYFSESEITDATSKILMHNAIDRFTGGTIDGALYTEKTWFHGKTVLNIQIDTRTKNKEQDMENEKAFYGALAAAILDLHLGLLSVGGLTSIGRGLFSIEKIEINGKEIAVEKEAGKIPEMYQQLIQEMVKGGCSTC